jgi:glycosyltransferase involved in cell wall biosynthesis
MRILVDYRAALRARTGVGEYIRELVRAYAATYRDDVAVFSSSWKDRASRTLSSELGVEVIDRRIPVRVLNWLWHRAEWPAVERLAGDADVVHAAHPLLIPAQRAAQVVTIHDLFFLTNPERTRAEIRRDYPVLAPKHARRADAVITSTAHTKALLCTQLAVQADHVYVCPPGKPTWNRLGRAPNVPADGCILFVGTLEPRKNIGALLDAYQELLSRNPTPPRLVLAGRATDDAAPWLARIAAPPLAGHAVHLGYVPDADRESLYESARVLVLPSLDEGFGLPVLDAMAAGVPVVAARRGSLPEVVADGGTLIDPTDVREIADALERVITDDRWARAQAEAGLARAAAFTWEAAARTLHSAYRDAVARRQARTR